jgi:uncharacterized protein (TIGR03083 family)
VPAPRHVDPGAARDAFVAAWSALRPRLGELDEATLRRPSALGGWTVSDLVAHLGLVHRTVVAQQPAPRGTRPHRIDEYVASYASGRQAIADGTRAAAGGPDRSRATLLAAVDEQAARSAAALAAWGDRVAGDPVVQARRGPIRLGDFLATRVVELVVHGDDLARSVPGSSLGDAPPDAVRLAVRVLLDVLATRAPGRTVEVRVPPFAAVQCVAGPRHTRGTPPNVVETDATTWLRLAAGRVPWADARAAALVTASGGRAEEVAAHLPLL